MKASYGHVRDLPESASQVPDEIKKKKWGRLGVDTDGDFKPYYVVPDDKRKNVAELKAALKGASAVMLATDPDREGESISWHLLRGAEAEGAGQAHRLPRDHRRRRSSRRSADAHDVDDNLVRAQESRRILDRLYGYTLSPVLWKKVQTGLSAGRVQSVAVRLIVDREEERLAFRAATLLGSRTRSSRPTAATFAGTLTRLGDVRVASGKDFDQQGVLTGKNVRLLSDADAGALVEALNRNLPWSVTSVEEKPGVERPARAVHDVDAHAGSEPQARASRPSGRCRRRSGCSRTATSPITAPTRRRSATKALAESARAIREMFGDDYYAGPRRYATKVKNAQEAHEAIRPTDFTSAAAVARRRARAATTCASTS